MRQLIRLAAPALLLALSTACIWGPDDTSAPEPRRCNADAAAVWTPDAIDILEAAYDPTPLEDGDWLPLQLGGQGSDMFGIAVQVHGTDVPDCVAMDVSYSNGFHESGPLALTHESDRHFTDNLMSVGSHNGDLTITVTVGELSRSVTVFVSYDRRMGVAHEVDSLTSDSRTMEPGQLGVLRGTLDGAAAEGGFEVTLASSSPALEVLEDVIFVPAGASSFDVPVAAREIGTVEVTATPGTASLTLEIVPPT